MDEPFGRIPEVETYGGGELVTILTITSKANQNLSDFSGLLDQGGQQLEVMYEPGTPLASDPKVEGVEVYDGADGGPQGRDIPEFQQFGPVLREQSSAEKVVGEEELSASNFVDKLRRAARYLHVSASGSKRKIFARIKEEHLSGLRMQAFDAAHEECEALIPKPRFEDAPKQPSAKERKLHEVTHLPFQPWCAFCVQAKSSGHYKHRSTGEDRANRSFPTVQIIFFHLVQWYVSFDHC